MNKQTKKYKKDKHTSYSYYTSKETQKDRERKAHWQNKVPQQHDATVLRHANN